MVGNRTILIVGGLAALGVGLYVWKSGGIANAAQAVGSGAVNAAGGVASGAVGAVGAAVGLPTPAQTVTDASTARWLIDNAGHLEASKWSGAPAYIKALLLPSGSGTAPDPRSDAGRAFLGAVSGPPQFVSDTGDETARLLARYPAPYNPDPSQSVFNTEGSFGAGTSADSVWGGYGLSGYGQVLPMVPGFTGGPASVY